MIRYKAIGEYAHYGEVYLINGKGYALRREMNNSAPCGHCALFNIATTDTDIARMCCGHPNKEMRMCKHEPGTLKGWNTLEYVAIPQQCIMPDEQLSLFN